MEIEGEYMTVGLRVGRDHSSVISPLLQVVDVPPTSAYHPQLLSAPLHFINSLPARCENKGSDEGGKRVGAEKRKKRERGGGWGDGYGCGYAVSMVCYAVSMEE